jgi:hypothetical protein
MTITLEAIEAQQSKLADMIADFKRQAESSVITLPGTTISLAPGELYAGILLGDDGRPAHHLILLPGDVDGHAWEAAKSWAQEQGGELPTRREQSLLFANLKSHFEARWYWSAEEYEDDTACAWSQYFYYGNQNGNRKGSFNCRARAVRRLEIQ